MNLIIGLSMLILGGISAGSSYVPLKGIKGWVWESLWAVQGIGSFLLRPFLVVLLAKPHLFSVLHRKHVTGQQGTANPVPAEPSP